MILQSTDPLGRVVLVIAHNADSIAAAWKDGFPCSPQNIGHAAVSILIGKPRASGSWRSNRRLFLGFFHDGHNGLRVIVGLRFKRMPGTRRLALQALLGTGRGCRRGGYGREDAAIEKKDILKARGYTGAPESSGDRSAGIATWRTPRRRQRCCGYEQV